MYQNIYITFLSTIYQKRQALLMCWPNFLGVIIYTAFNPRRRKNIWAYAELLNFGVNVSGL